MAEVLCMEPADSYSQMLGVLGDAFRTRYRRKDVNIVGILFARPESRFTQDEILPNINYWHHRSDHHTDFFCPGYLREDELGYEGKPAIEIGGIQWCFSVRSFVAVLAELEDCAKWRYSGGCELLLTNARYDKVRQQASLDLSSAIVFDLEAAKQDGAFREVNNLCETIFQFAANLNEAVDDPVWEFSDKQGLRIVRGSLKSFLVSYLPSWLKPEARKAFHFVTTDIAPQPSRQDSPNPGPQADG